MRPTLLSSAAMTVWCGQPWTSDELVAGGALEPYYGDVQLPNRYAGLTRIDDDDHAHVPVLPAAWPHCPMCDAPLRRIQMGNTWECAPPTATRNELAA